MLPARQWKGSVYAKRGILYFRVKDTAGVWRACSTHLLDTPDNRVSAWAMIEGARGKLPPRQPPRPAPRRRPGFRASGATTRSSFKRSRGEDLACECCGWRPRPPLGRRAVNVHHICPRSAGGTDAPENFIALCPNCHALAHAIFGRKDPCGRAVLLDAIRAATAQPLAVAS
jgi:hypothetical protein